MRSAALLASSLPLLLLLLSLLPSPTSAQAYVPNPRPFTASQCPPGQSFVQLGRLDSSNATAFPNNAQGTQLGALYWNPYYQYAYTTPFTNRHFGANITQLAVAVLDNSGLPGPVYFRLGLYLFQEPQRNIFGFNEAALLGQSDEITLYPSKDQVIYANLLQPVTLESEGDYGIAIYRYTAQHHTQPHEHPRMQSPPAVVCSLCDVRVRAATCPSSSPAGLQRPASLALVSSGRRRCTTTT